MNEEKPKETESFPPSEEVSSKPQEGKVEPQIPVEQKEAIGLVNAILADLRDMLTRNVNQRLTPELCAGLHISVTEKARSHVKVIYDKYKPTD